MEAQLEQKDREHRSIDTRRVRISATQCVLHLVFAALGALLGRTELLFGVCPFGIALAAAAGKVFPAVAIGNVTVALIAKDYASVLALGILSLIRLLYSMLPVRSGASERVPLLGERIVWRAIAGSIALFTVSAFTLFRGGFLYYHLFALLLGTAVTGLATLLLGGFFSPRERLFLYSREAGLATLALLCLFCLREVSILGFYPAAVGASLGAFWLCAHYGAAAGAVGGLLAGVCFDVRLAPAFLLCALGFAFLEKSTRGGGILVGCGLSSVYTFAVSGAVGLTALLPSLLSAGAVFLAGDSAGLIEGSPAQRIAMLRRRGALRAAREMEGAYSAKRLREISGTLGELSGIFYELGNAQRRPGLLDLRHLCDREFDKVCPGCAHRNICWGSEYAATAAAVSALGTRLHTSGTVDRTQIPPLLAARCRELPRVLEGIESGAQRLCEEALRGDKTSVMAMDYAALGRVMSETLEHAGEAHQLDAELGARIAARLQRQGYSVESVSVCGKAHRRILLRGLRLPGRHVKIRELRRSLEQLCHFPLGEAEQVGEAGVQDILFAERASLCVTTQKMSRAKSVREGGYCGDSVMSFSGEDGYEYAFLCDGMGSGNSAALTSAFAATVLSRFLRAGNRAESSLRILNGVMAARGHRENEASTTVDLLEIDCVRGEAALFKCGAAPTYLLRAGSVTRFFSRTAPLGILESLDAERLRFAVQPGDVLVQVSDGITGGEEECVWLSDMLMTKWDGNAESFARLVLNHSQQQGGDDLSVVITEITEAPLVGVEDDRTA